MTTLIDPVDVLLAALKLAFKEPSDKKPSDDLMGRCSSHFGQVLRDDYNLNHLDEVNQVLGLVSLFETNPKTAYRNQANRLKNQDL